MAIAVLLLAPCEARAQSANDRAALAPARSPAFITIASAVVPGSGQAMMHQKRGALFMALEAAGIGFYISQNRDGNRQRNRYRGLSRTVARAAFEPDGPTGSWDYYERMEKFVESGAFDAVDGGDLNPEMNVDTYNGSMWLLARQTFWRDADVAPAASSPEYQAALNFYKSRAVTPEFRWSWAGSPDAFRKYRSAIAASNSAFRKAEQTASLVLANHFLSAVDAYVSVRMRARRTADGKTVFSVAIPL